MKSGNKLSNITPEQRAEYLEQGRIARQEKITWAKDNLKLDYTDENHWKSLASKYNVRLPAYYHSNSSVKYVKRMAKAVGADILEYVEAMGCKSLSEMVKLNPKQNAVAMCGLFLEWHHEKRTNGYNVSH